MSAKSLFPSGCEITVYDLSLSLSFSLSHTHTHTHTRTHEAVHVIYVITFRAVCKSLRSMSCTVPSLFCSCRMEDQVSHPYEINDVIVEYVLHDFR